MHGVWRLPSSRSSPAASEANNLPSSEGGMQPPLVYAGRRWDFCGTRFERDEDGSETRWLLFLDLGAKSRPQQGSLGEPDDAFACATLSPPEGGVVAQPNLADWH